MLGSRATSGRASPHPTGQNTRETEPNTAATSTHTILFRIRSTAARSHDSSVRRATCSWPTHTFMLRIRSTAARSYDSSVRRDHVPWLRGHYVAIGHHITIGRRADSAACQHMDDKLCRQSVRLVSRFPRIPFRCDISMHVAAPMCPLLCTLFPPFLPCRRNAGRPTRYRSASGH